ncbi:hypothetical protein [Streptomyces lateritius]|uniref:hypothetical protein n=1 Tax=Streptomyces lateritius TaxID=67313 RepID=UPI001C8C50D4|nr:hypothetical protein [Streptomyces lateritius]MBX9425490.1 hypothetical protein [Streptomyces lateritius]
MSAPMSEQRLAEIQSRRGEAVEAAALADWPLAEYGLVKQALADSAALLAEVSRLRTRIVELEAADEEDIADPDAEWRRIEAESPKSAITHRCGIPLVRRLDCGHCPHEVCEDCGRCPHTCRCAAPASVPQQRSEAS